MQNWAVNGIGAMGVVDCLFILKNIKIYVHAAIELNNCPILWAKICPL